jgi:hypothetical protein
MRQDGAVDPTQAADRLYTVPPRRFVAERDVAVAAARAEGDTATAAELARLRRPTVGAWLVNLLALRRPELVSDLAELATALQAAQRELAGDQLRQLGHQRRATVSALVATARSLAEQAEPELAGGKLPLTEVEATLNAALADREVAGTVRAGRLTRAASYEGFGDLPRARLRLLPGGAAEPAAGTAGASPAGTAAPEAAGPDRAAGRDEAIRQAIAAELAAARVAAEAASRELDRAAADQDRMKRELAEIDSALAELATRRAAAAERLAAAERTSRDARRAVVAARRRQGEAEAAEDRLLG